MTPSRWIREVAAAVLVEATALLQLHSCRIQHLNNVVVKILEENFALSDSELTEFASRAPGEPSST